ncbi:nitroreductase family protein [Agromyces sp. Marseille-Q5079]|uniref:nitroreductase family protein n=1 Tax=Agromyces sp. Marseille-Q5079 TaxID=3439059 RepID=UPI003D9CBB12
MRDKRLLRREFAQDYSRYARQSVAVGPGSHSAWTNENLECQLTKDYHRVEKGLALPAPKRPFGHDLGRRLDKLIARAQEMKIDAPYVGAAREARQALDLWNSTGQIVDQVSPLDSGRPERLGVSDEFFRSRHSVRDFTGEAIERRTLLHAVELATQSPSVCNRQPWHVRLLTDRQSIQRALQFQNGNRGFTEVIPALYIVTVDQRLFAGAGERNQAWIEGGIFASSLVWALHAEGLESCMLNMSVVNAVSTRLRAEFDIEDQEVVICMIAAGHGRPGHRRARSLRRTIEDLMRPSPVEQS